MPAAVGFVNIVSVGSSGVVQFGDTVQISPQSSAKTYAGSGSFLTGGLTNANNGLSATNTLDPDLQDNANNKVAAGANII
jgi:hypothetical protein